MKSRLQKKRSRVLVHILHGSNDDIFTKLSNIMNSNYNYMNSVLYCSIDDIIFEYNDIKMKQLKN